MKFKEDHGKRDYQNISAYPSRENVELRKLVDIIDQLSVDGGHGEITITDYIRPNPNSLHFTGRAVDIRVRDKPVSWYIAICELGKALVLMNKCWRINPHYELYRQAQQHIHLEVRVNK